MLYAEERKREIKDYIQGNSRASVQELSQFFEVSESTVRRDLKELEEEKLLRRTHGGAIALQNVNFEPTFNEKEDKFQEEKKAIARKALEFIEEGDTILLDAGTTTFQLVKELRAFSKLTVVTNSLVFAQELQDVQGIDVVIVGGDLRKEMCALVGPLTEAGLSMMRVDKAFIATNGIEAEEGLTTPNLTEAATKRKMIQIAKQVILLADHSKAGKAAFAKFADIHEVDKCIIDAGVPDSFVEKLREIGIDVYVVCP
ncbi:DeoR family fructose operon transcriptional repressor [Neobacillus sp. B4I6]|uniref:DeoR/GlpR family DNA-binding transcription regulator n=1 Tax=Bacillaceae TaxID=186817 RepID=UPI001BE7A001|nr:DeoR/GlpR family DNA-binding transcription regulator [Bacillus sp. ISL-75]MBT2729948.1 DeoR/GlpR transcriptional regulator [Bacillus sp. ISL-75]